MQKGGIKSCVFTTIARKMHNINLVLKFKTFLSYIRIIFILLQGCLCKTILLSCNVILNSYLFTFVLRGDADKSLA
jgi:hypothetical protein